MQTQHPFVSQMQQTLAEFVLSVLITQHVYPELHVISQLTPVTLILVLQIMRFVLPEILVVAARSLAKLHKLPLQ